MMDEQRVLQHANAGASVHRRHLVKPDGRDVFIYGNAPHTLEVAKQMLEGGPKRAELRWHPLRQEWSVYASGRQNRTFKPSLADDPLAPSAPGGPVTEIPFADFEVAIFENRFPSFSADPGPADTQISGVKSARATGRCEVIVYTPQSTGSIATLSAVARRLLVHAWIDRYEDLFSSGAHYVLPFENRGEEVGVTLLHPHGQLYAFSQVPAVQMRAAQAFEEGYDFARHLAAWRGDYEIFEQGGVSAFAPPFARFPYEVWVAPLQKRKHLCEFTSDEIEAFAQAIGEVTARYDRFFGRDCPYMFSLHAAPNNGSAHADWHFTAQFYPILRSADKVKYLASVEQATGLFTVDVAPEETARVLREI